ncbi:20624_t:CDS:1, partial [Cetraspora pellucida]
MESHLALHCNKTSNYIVTFYLHEVAKRVKKLALDDDSEDDAFINSDRKKRKIKNTHKQLPQLVKSVSEDYRREINQALIKAFICCGIPWAVIDNPFFTLPHRDILANWLLNEELAIIT